MRYTIAFGNAFDGITFHGVFNDYEDALYIAETTSSDEWHIIEIDTSATVKGIDDRDESD